MSGSGAIAEIVAERWSERAFASYPAESAALLSAGQDPFRNPAGHTIRESLGTLVRELLGAMNESAVASALDALVRLRAVQGFLPSQALGFIFELRGIMPKESSALTPDLPQRIDRLALMAFDRYMACRDQIDALREKELRIHLKFAAR